MNIARLVRSAIIAGGALALANCASLSEKQCRSQDWQNIGYRDGSNGHSDFRMSDHQEACAKYDIAPDSNAYDTGRQRGLERYCTITGGLRAGRNGGVYAGVCPAKTEAAFLHAYQLGLEINRAEERLNAIRSERNAVRYRLREIDESRKDERRDRPDRDHDNSRSRDNDRYARERDALIFRLRELEREEWLIGDDYRHLEWEARRLR